MRNLVIFSAILLLLSGCGPSASGPTFHPERGPAAIGDVSVREARALNALRAQYGLHPLTPNARLARIAQGHAQDMLNRQFFGHTSSDGRTIVERTRGGGYRFCHVAENLAIGLDQFEAVLQRWMGSPSHRRNLLHPNVDEFGLAQGPSNIWVLVLGRPGC